MLLCLLLSLIAKLTHLEFPYPAMCLNRRYIVNPYTSKRLVVDCGHCPSCLQAKAVQRTNRIRNNIDLSESKCLVLFCTFTYRNSCVPYFNYSEFLVNDEFNIKRDSVVRYVKTGNKRYGRRSYKKTVDLCTLSIPHVVRDQRNFKFLRCKSGYDNDRIGVIYNKDFQDFIKRLRINLSRKYHYENDLSYFYCSEYGPRTGRPHFHALFFIPLGYYALFKSAIASTWSFDDYKQCRRNIQIAKNCAGYVSTYVNCDSYIPSVYKEFKEIRPSHRYSQGFGMAKKCLSLSTLLECYRKRDLHIDSARYRGQSLVVDRILFPKYALYRYFPKFKGMRYLTTDEIKQVYERPESVRRFAKICNLTEENIKAIVVLIRHKQQLFARHFPASYFDLSSYLFLDFATIASQIHTIYASNVLRDFYEQQVERNILTAYDNIKEQVEFYHPYLVEDLNKAYPKTKFYFPELNEFPQIVHKTKKLEHFYHEYTKDRKVRNIIYSKIMNV